MNKIFLPKMLKDVLLPFDLFSFQLVFVPEVLQ